MNDSAPQRRAPDRSTVDPGVLDELCAVVLASLPRRDQRERATHYIRGLLTVEGRKSFRNMAAQLGGGVTLEQRLHHFVSCSTWDWMPVRHALTRALAAAGPPDAFVLRHLLVPKGGNESVGVHRRYVPEAKRMLNLQYAVGTWAGSAQSLHPVGWRLLLPRVWTDDPARRARVQIPDRTCAQTPAECAADGYLEAIAGFPEGERCRPVVVNVDGADAPTVIQRFRAARVPFLVKAEHNVPLVVVEPDPAHRPPRTYATRQILAAARESATGAEPAVAVPVRSPRRTRAPLAATPDECDLLLVGSAGGPGRGPDGAWLTNMLDAGVPRLLELIRLAGRAAAAQADLTGALGIKDFVGRTYDGWHRHATLVSVAHGAVLMSRTAAARQPSGAAVRCPAPVRSLAHRT